jgi:4-hydroxy-tetrahydrodipicolinate synthase
VHGLVATGSTGETPTLTLEERERVWAIVVEETGGRAFVVAGTGTNSTRESIEWTRRAAAAGVDGCMLVAPYYNKPTQRGLLAHFRAVADAAPVPLVLYNVPSRTGVNLLPETVAALAAHERIAALKEASGSLDQVTAVLGAAPGLVVLSGDDSLTLPVVAAGGKGVVSVAGHVVGRELCTLVELAAGGATDRAGALHRRLFPFIQALFRETNPAPIKAVLWRRGLIRNELRLPLVPVGEETLAVLDRELARLGDAEPPRA